MEYSKNQVVYVDIQYAQKSASVSIKDESNILSGKFGNMVLILSNELIADMLSCNLYNPYDKANPNFHIFVYPEDVLSVAEDGDNYIVDCYSEGKRQRFPCRIIDGKVAQIFKNNQWVDMDPDRYIYGVQKMHNFINRGIKLEESLF